MSKLILPGNMGKWDESDHRPGNTAPIDPYVEQQAYQRKVERLYKDAAIAFGGYTSISCDIHGRKKVGLVDPSGKIRPAIVPGMGQAYERQVIKGCVACKHVMGQDADRPEGIFLLPNMIYLCRICMKAWENRHLNFETELTIQCWLCVCDTVSAIKKRHPDKFTDLTQGRDIRAFDPLGNKKPVR